MATVMKPILLDETGKEIIKAINGVSNALKDKRRMGVNINGTNN